MDTFFNPASLVIIGASNAPGNLGATICRALTQYLPFAGALYAVNTKGEDVHGCPGYASIRDLPGAVDLAVILTPAHAVPECVRQCGQKGIRHIVIESSGFSEAGEEGRALQARIDAAARDYGLLILGPNCLGTINTHNKFTCFYGIQAEDVQTKFQHAGQVSYILQSGGIGVLVLESLHTDVVKTAKMVSLGNKSNVDEADMLEYLGQDEATAVIGMYLESIRDGRKLMQAARRLSKPVIVFKTGKTGAGALAAQSHTAGMATDERIFAAACRQAGLIQARSLNELYALPKIFTHMPPLKGRRIAVFTNSGAFGGITADLLVEAGFELAQLSDGTQARLRRVGQVFNAANPVDLGPVISAQPFLDAFAILLAADEVDGLLAVPSLWHHQVIDPLLALVRMCRTHGKPAAIYTPNATAKTAFYRQQFQAPLFEAPEEAVRALAASYQHYRYHNA